MGRKGVNKRKNAKAKVLPAGNSGSNGHNPEIQTDQVVDKARTWSRDTKKQK
jgi:hypothetical protein